ncbi:MAG TPA: hypothetical protein VGR35_16300 [Tepidisphaeraceae bacterium]|nr:hypothetical protein [Tepidisphaeraceae bacterium]
MATRIGKVLVLASTAALVGTICAWAFASQVDCRSQQISLGPGLYASIRGFPVGGEPAAG